jgi:hypothetical protein
MRRGDSLPQIRPGAGFMNRGSVNSAQRAKTLPKFMRMHRLALEDAE